MKYKYEVEVKDLGFKKILYFKLPQEIKTLSGFLSSSIKDQATADWFLTTIDLVLTGESYYEEIGGEIYALQIKPDKTRVYDSYTDELNEDPKIESYIETSELKELIIAWMKELKKFRSQQESEPKTNPQETQNKSQENQSS